MYFEPDERLYLAHALTAVSGVVAMIADCDP
jgi:hypothetical protein